MKFRSKALLLALCAVLLVAATIFGTMAYLTANTQTVTNTFTVSNITVELKETTGTEYKMIPGYTISKDPTVKVVAGSEQCFLFVKLDKSENFGTFLTYDMAEGWTALTGQNGVYYREVPAANTDTEFSVLKDNKVTVKSDVTKEKMNALKQDTYPTLKITAYASQLYKDATTKFEVAEAWATVNPTTVTP